MSVFLLFQPVRGRYRNGSGWHTVWWVGVTVRYTERTARRPTHQGTTPTPDYCSSSTHLTRRISNIQTVAAVTQRHHSSRRGPTHHPTYITSLWYTGYVQPFLIVIFYFLFQSVKIECDLPRDDRVGWNFDYVGFSGFFTVVVVYCSSCYGLYFCTLQFN